MENVMENRTENEMENRMENGTEFKLMAFWTFTCLKLSGLVDSP